MLGALCSLGQAPAIQWQKSLGGSLADKANSIQQTTDGGYIVAGETNSNDGDVTVNNGTANTTDYWVAKIDATGLLSWQKNLGGDNEDRANAIVQTADGGYMVVGASRSSNDDVTSAKGQSDAWIVKLDATGTISWQKSLGGTADDEACAVQQTADGGYIIAGNSRSNNFDLTANNGQSDFWVIKTDAAGVIQWQKSAGGSGTDNAYSVQQTSDGGYIVCGSSNSNNADVTGNNGGTDFWVVKLSSTGTISWQKSLGGSGSETAYSIKQTSDGGYIVCGKTDSNNGNVSGNNGVENAWVVKLSSTGTITWQDCFGGTGFDAAYSIQQTADGGYIFGGSASSNSGDLTGNKGSNDYWVVKLSSTGAITWQQNLGGSGSDVGTSIHQTADNGYVVAGRSNSANNDITNSKGADDFWVVKFAGTPVTVGLPANTSGAAAISVYPNPARGSLTIANIAPLEGGSIRLTDVAGKLVYTQEIGSVNEQANISQLNKGIYFLQVSDATTTVIHTQKVIID